MLSNNEILSKTITFLRFPLIIAVVFIHTGLDRVNIGGKILVSKGQFPLHDMLNQLVSQELARIAVPLFFFMSGFLFFRQSEFSLSAYKTKLKKRIRTLLIPYVFWNIAVLFLFFQTQTFLSSMTSGMNKLITEYTLSDWFGVFWNHREGMPICYQFWFIRDLMVVILCSPLVYGIVRYGKVASVIFLGLLWCFGLWFHIVGFSITALFFFSFGAWFAVSKNNFIVKFKPLRLSFTFLYLLIIVADTFCKYHELHHLSFLHNIGIIIGLIAVISWTAYGIESQKLKCSTWLAGSTFFIYAYHGMPIAFLTKYWVKQMQPASELTMVLGYLVIPLVVVGLGLVFYHFMQKVFPRFTGFITGGR